MSDDALQAMQRLERNYARLRKAENSFPELTLVAVRTNGGDASHPGDDPTKAAWVKAIEYANRPGWVRRRSGLWSSETNGEADMADETLGPPLFGEWVTGKNESVHLRPDAEPGKLRFWTYTERALRGNAGLADGEAPALCQQVWVIANPDGEKECRLAPDPEGDPKRVMRRVVGYHVYWGGAPDDPHAIRRLFARFVGFSCRNVRLRDTSQSDAANAEARSRAASETVEATP